MQSKTSNQDVMPAVLTIAGSDSGGGAGIQADLKTFSALEVFGTTAITCVTAQSPVSVNTISPLDPELILQQIKAVCDNFPVRAAKTGMLYTAEIIRTVAQEDLSEGIPILVVDPVMVAASGARLLQADAIDAMKEGLLPVARVVTPNLQEAEIICGHTISSVEEMKEAAREIAATFDIACVIKGGHLDGDEVIDFLYDEGEEFTFTAPRIRSVQTHGTGCAFSAALTAYLARRELMSEAVRKAKVYVHEALRQAPTIGRHQPLHFQWNCGAASDA